MSPSEVAEQVSQDVAVEVLRSLPSLRDGAAFDAWVHRITVRNALRAAEGRRGRGRVETALTGVDGFGDASSDLDFVLAARSALESGLANEQELLRDVFAPARALEPTDGEVAEVLRRLDAAPADGRHRVRVDRFFVPALGVTTAIAVAILAIVLGGGTQPSRLGVPAGTPPAPQRRDHQQELRQAEANTTRAPAALLDSFPLFSDGALGAHPSGITILHPSLPSLPSDVLGMTTGGAGRLDPHQIRQVRSSSGADFYVIPGPDGACIYSISVPVSRRPSNGLYGVASGASGTCSGSLTRTLANGLVDGEHLPDGTAITVGVMPAWVREVVLVYPGGANRSVPLTYGVFVIRNAGVREILLPGLRPNAMIRLH